MVTPDRWRRIDEIFGEAVGLPEPEWAAFVAAACGDDVELRDEVESLLASASETGEPLRDAIGGAARALDRSSSQRHLGTRLGSYRLLEVIGEGGMGTVYLAERDDAEYRRKVAIKVLRHGLASPLLVARFRDERQVLASLDHPGIVRLLDGGRTDDGLPYLVMEHVDGILFASRVRSLDVRGRIELVLRIAEALQYAHQKLVVHRDVKPSNILVDGTGAPKLLDFGIAKLIDPSAAPMREALTGTGMALFTVEYASPEQVRGEPVSVATDVYSLGAVLYDALVGAPPQRAGASWVETLTAISERDPTRPSLAAPSALRRELAGDLDNIVLKALQRRADRRYASVADLADDLRRYLTGLPVAARDATLGYRARKFAARNRGTIALAGLVALALSVATVVSFAQARRADDQATRAENDRRALLADRGRLELASGHAGRALAYLAEALREGDDTPALRFLLAEAMRPFTAKVATMHSDVGLLDAIWSADGALIATTGEEGHAHVFDATGALRFDVAVDRRPLRRPAFSPDGQRLASATSDGRVFVWDTATGARRLVIAAHASFGLFAVSGVSFAGDRLITTGLDGQVRVWNAVTGANIVSVEGDDGEPVTASQVSPDGAQIAVGAQDGSISIVDARTGARLARLVGHHGAIDRIVYGPDGSRLYSLGEDNLVRIWDLSRATAIAAVPGVTVDVDPAGDRLVTGGDSVVRIWDARSGALLGELIGADAGPMRETRFSRDGKRVVTADSDGSFRVWDVATGACENVLEAVPTAGSAVHSAYGALDARFSPDGTRLLTLSGIDATIWRIDRAPLVTDLATGGELWVASFSPDGDRVATGGWGVAAIWERNEPATAVPLAVASAGPAVPLAMGGYRSIYDIGWSPDGTRLVVVGEPDIARIFTSAGTLVRALGGHQGTVNRGSFSPDGSRIATAGDDHTARIWDAATGAQLIVLAHPDRVMAAAWSPDGAHIATAGWDHRARIWDAATGAQLAELDGGDVQFLDVTFSPDGRSLAAACHGGEVQVWDLATGTRRLVLEGHTGAVTNAVWSPDGSLIATSDDDFTARIWDPATGALLATRHHPGGVMSVQWSRDGSQILTAATDGSARVWDVHRDQTPVAEVQAFVAARVPFHLVNGRLETVTPTR